ncbi:MAG: hypothetical protein IPP81_19000 [Chitinophagaceae bacterium]|nr:hypothetical protein [Chitinophagaceae bacterium]
MATCFFVSCDTNKKLNQVNAEKAIKEFVSNNALKGSGSWGQTGTLNVEAIQKIDPISQFSETQASAIVNFNFHDSFSDGNLILKFIFNKNVDKKWILTSIEPVQGVGSEGLSNWVRKQQNINIVAQ